MKLCNWVVTLDWDTGERTRMIVRAWDTNSAKVMGLAQIPTDLHERVIVNADKED